MIKYNVDMTTATIRLDEITSSNWCKSEFTRREVTDDARLLSFSLNRTVKVEGFEGRWLAIIGAGQ